jgi:membrane-bound ClpP family serine protease
MWRTYGKSIAMGVAAAVMAGVTAYRAVSGDGVTPSEWVAVVLAVMGAANVWAAANIPAFAKAKVFVAALFVVGQVLQTSITGGISADEWLLLVIQFLGALGVVAAPSRSTSPPAIGA